MVEQPTAADEAWTIRRYPSALVCVTAFVAGSFSDPLATVVDSVHDWRLNYVEMALVTQSRLSERILRVGLGAQRLAASRRAHCGCGGGAHNRLIHASTNALHVLHCAPMQFPPQDGGS